MFLFDSTYHFFLIIYKATVLKSVFCSVLAFRYSSRAQRHYDGLSVSSDLPPARPTFIGYLLSAYSFINYIYFDYWLIFGLALIIFF